MPKQYVEGKENKASKGQGSGFRHPRRKLLNKIPYSAPKIPRKAASAPQTVSGFV